MINREEVFTEFYDTYTDTDCISKVSATPCSVVDDIPSHINWYDNAFRCIHSTTLEKLRLCHEFAIKNKRAPKPGEKYNSFDIGDYVHSMTTRRGPKSKIIIKKIFGNTIRTPEYSFMNETLCKFEALEKFCSENKRIPNEKDDGETDIWIFYSKMLKKGSMHPTCKRIMEICAPYK